LISNSYECSQIYRKGGFVKYGIFFSRSYVVKNGYPNVGTTRALADVQSQDLPVAKKTRLWNGN
jgi:hypothetical protein